MNSIRIGILLLCCSNVTAETLEPKSYPFVQLAKVGQSARLRKANGKYDVTIYSKRKKLEILARHEKARREQQKRKQAANQLFDPPSSPGLLRVVSVGPDYIGFLYPERKTKTIFVPAWAITSITLEQTAKEAEE